MSQSLPISIDVQVSVSQAQAAIAYDMTLACIVIPGPTPVVTRVAYYSTYASAIVPNGPVVAGSSTDYALKAFFAQVNRPNGVCVGEVDPANDFIAEIALIQAASVANAKPIYGWILDASFRDTAHQVAFADWIVTQPFGVAVLVTNNVLAYSSVDVTNIAYHCLNTGNERTAVIFHESATYYPDASILSFMLAVDYTLANSTVTAKFKDLPGIPVSTLTATQLSTLESRRCNAFTLVGNGNRTFRDGVVSAVGWFLDTVINLDNFTNDMQTAVFNVFLQNNKVPYTTPGQMMLAGAATNVCEQYTNNGTFASRDVPKASGNGYTTLPAYQIAPSPVGGASASARAARTCPPIKITAYESGAMHTVSVNVSAIQ